MDIPNELQNEVADLLAFLEDGQTDEFLYELTEARLDFLKLMARNIDGQLGGNERLLAQVRDWFRQQTDPVFSKSQLIHRARTWPEGYPGDYVTLEAVYSNQPSGDGIGQLLDRYFLSRTLAVAVRSRLRTMARLLAARAAEETTRASWLNLAAGSARELLSVPSGSIPRHIVCVDSDPKALAYAQRLLTSDNGDNITFVAGNAFRFANAKRNIERFGEFSTIYSAGLFDYVKSEQLVRLLAGLYGSLASGGLLIAPFKDATRYETFDYHWVVKWHFFVQRTEDTIREMFSAAGIPGTSLTVHRDGSGVVLFFVARK